MNAFLNSHLSRFVYLPDNTRKTFRHCVNHWCRLMGDVIPSSTDDFHTFRKLSVDAGYSAATIEKTVYRVWSICHEAGLDIPIGKKLRQRKPSPTVPSVEDVGAVFNAVSVAKWPRRLNAHDRATWWRAWIATVAWTGYRLGDMERLQWSSIDDRVIRIAASKTGKAVGIPLLPWLDRLLVDVRGRFGINVFANSARKQLRRELKRFSESAGVRYIPPHGFRRFAISSWAAADGLAGQIIHGCRIGVMAHYLDAERHLLRFAPAVPIPRSFLPRDESLAAESDEKVVVDLYHRMPSDKQRLVLSLVRELA